MIKSNPHKFLAELEYYLKYYGNEFKSNQGLDVIIGVVQKYSKEGTWLDLGGGSNSPFWRMFFPELSRIVCMDINQEAFILSELIVHDFDESPCYKVVRERFCQGKRHNSNVKIEYKVRNLLSEEIVADTHFDNVTQFGLLGLLKNEDDFVKKTKEILFNLKEKGIYIGVNWIFSKPYQEKMGVSNSYICEELLLNVAVEKVTQLFYQEIEIQNDPNYDKCIIYVMEKAL